MTKQDVLHVLNIALLKVNKKHYFTGSFDRPSAKKGHETLAGHIAKGEGSADTLEQGQVGQPERGQGAWQ